MTRWSIEERVVMLGDLWLFADELDQQYNYGGEYYPFEVTEDGLFDELLQICDSLLGTGAADEKLRNVLLSFSRSIRRMTSSDDKLDLAFTLLREMHKIHSRTNVTMKLPYVYLSFGHNFCFDFPRWTNWPSISGQNASSRNFKVHESSSTRRDLSQHPAGLLPHEQRTCEAVDILRSVPSSFALSGAELLRPVDREVPGRVAGGPHHSPST